MLYNPSFEAVGATPGQAFRWTFSSFTALERIAGFGSPEEGQEDFERWFELAANLSDVTVVLGFFDGSLEGYEDFEEAWGIGVYLTELPPAQTVPVPFDGSAVEHCETGWSNGSFAWEFANVPNVVGVFDGTPREAFEAHWHGNESYLRDWFFVTSNAASFSGGGAERFESNWPSATTL